MERKRYRKISIKKELADKVEGYIKNNPDQGYRSIAEFVEDSIRRRLEELKRLFPEESH